MTKNSKRITSNGGSLSIIFILGVASGLPFLLTLATLHIRLAENQISKSTIGLFALVTLPYTLKFLWAPLIDSFHFGRLTKSLGPRKSWLVLSQIGLCFSIIGLGLCDPGIRLWPMALLAFFTAFFSATQDIVYEAVRIELLPAHKVGTGASVSMLGYRFGIWISGALALYLASFFGWALAHFAMALIILFATIASLKCPEPSHNLGSPRKFTSLSQLIAHVKEAFNFPKMKKYWWIGLAYILFYKIGDSTLNVMTAPFLIEIGFSKVEIAHVAKSFGIGMMIAGSVIGSYLLSKRPLIVTLIVVSILHVFSCVLFCLQAQRGYDVNFLILTIGIENLSCGVGTAGLIAYLSHLSKKPFTATHYAVLSSFASLCRVVISNCLGVLADCCAWEDFYALMAVFSLPSFLVLIIGYRYFYVEGKENILFSQHLQQN